MEMTISRRAILASTTGAVFAATLPNLEAIAQASPPIRPSIGDLALNDPIVQTFRDAVRIMKALPANHPHNWARLSQIHGTQQGGFNLCPHGNWYFLPWHRGYIQMYERLCRFHTNNPAFAMPYWDWTRDRQLPAAFRDPTYNGQPNSLFEPSRTIPPNFSLPDDMVGQNIINGIIAQTNFEIFGSTRPAGQNSIDPSWLQRRGSQGPLESNPHNRVHGTVGGIMASGGSPIDPIFMMHHCNIDRLWAFWNNSGRQNTTDPLWQTFRFINHFVNEQGQPISWTVRDLQQIIPLGYRYGFTPVRRPLPRDLRELIVRENRITELLRLSGVLPVIRPPVPPQPPGPEPRALIRNFATNSRPALPNQPLELNVAIAGDGLSQAAKTTRRGGDVFNLRTQLMQAPSHQEKRVIAVLSDITPPEGGNADVRVFLNCDYLSPETPTSDPHYVDTFSFFGGHHQGHAGHDGNSKVSLILDLTQTVQALGRQNRIRNNDLRVQIMPVPLPGQREAKPITPGRVDIAII